MRRADIADTIVILLNARGVIQSAAKAQPGNEEKKP
jgi:hypothetical protein